MRRRTTTNVMVALFCVVYTGYGLMNLISGSLMLGILSLVAVVLLPGLVFAVRKLEQSLTTQRVMEDLLDRVVEIERPLSA